MSEEKPYPQAVNEPKRKKRDWLSPVLAAAVAVSLGGLFLIVSQRPGDSGAIQLPAAHSRAVSQFKFCTNEMVNDLQVVEDKRAAVTPFVQHAVVGNYGVGENLDYQGLRSDIVSVYPKGGDDTGAFMALVLCQKEFRAKQEVLTYTIESFESWRGGLWFDWLDFQTRDIEVKTATGTLRGQAALNYLKQPIGPGF